MDPTGGLVDKFIEVVLHRIWEQLRYLVHYHRNTEQFYEKHKALTLHRSSIQHKIDEAKNNAEEIEDEVLHWLDEVDKIAEQVEQLNKDSQAKRECSITSCPNPWLRYKLSKRAKAMTQGVVEIHGKGNFNNVSYQVPLPVLGLTTGVRNEGIDSRVQIKEQIMEAVRNPSVNMVGLCGLGGVGKTTIAKDVGKEVEIQKMFAKVIMATVSQEMNIGHIQDQIIEKLGMQRNERTEEVKAFYLCKRLKQEKNMLLILDDLWEELNLDKVGISFVDVDKYSENNKGCKILLTSRNKALLSNCMKCEKIITVGTLLEDEAWELFKSIAGLSIESSSPDLKPIAIEIVQKCGGLPLAIATAAKALKEKNIDGWKDYLARLKHPLARSVTGIKEVDTILKLSYDALGRENKDIFLLAAMFSHDPSIEDLLMYSVGLDVLQHTENLEHARAVVSDIVSKLKSLNLFQDSFSRHCFTMHDVFRDVALSIASEELKAVIVRHRRLNEWPDENELEGCKGICLQESDISDLPEKLHGPILEFFLLNSKKFDLTIPNTFFKSSKKLKVLAFTNMHFSLLPSLSDLKKLKALCLHSCLLEDITEVGRLRKLKVLSLANCEIERLPIEVAELTSLQILNLSHCSKLKVIPQKLLSSLTKLEVLYMGNSFDQWKVEGCSEADENASLEELKDLPISSLDIQIPNVSMLPENLFLKMKLKRYRIFIGKRWKWQGNYETSKILRLELESGIDLTAGLRKLLEGVEDLHLYGSKGLENVLYSHEVRGSSCLRRLQIESNDDVEYIILNSAHREVVTKNVSNKILESRFNKVLLPKFEILELSNLSYSLIPLIWNAQLSHNSFSNMKRFIVKNCSFVKLVPLHVLISLKYLEELEIENCNMLKTVFDFEDLNDYKEIESSLVIVPLKKFKLRSLPKLKNVWSNHCQGNVSFPSLRIIYVYDCVSLTSIFPASIAKSMLHDLEELKISYCGINAIVAKDQTSESVAPAFEFPRLTCLKLSRLQKLKNFYPQRHTLEWPNLQLLSIENCDELEIFEKEVSSSSEIHEEERTLNSRYPLLPHNKVIHNLEELKLQGKQVEMIGTGQFPMNHFPKVKLLCLSIKKATMSYKSLLRSFPNLEKLQLSGGFLEAFERHDVVAPTLSASFSKLTLNKISITGSLSPFLVSSPNLTHLEVALSNGLTTLMTSSTARNLVHLTHLSIRKCSQLVKIITEQEGENDENKEIIFSKLELLKLYDLPRLKRFCGHNYTLRFPLLDQMIITRCPKFKIFSPGLIDTPSLKSVQLSRDLKEHHEVWDTNLNKTLYQQQFVASRELVLDEYDANMIRNDHFPREVCPEVEILRIERFVEEGVTFPYTLLEGFPNLNALHVEDCSFEEIFPSHAHIIYQIPPFKELCLANLTVLKVYKCHQLIYLVTNSTAKSLLNLETLEIDDCKKMEEIVKKETNGDVEGGITFNGLRILNLTRLPRLKIEENNRDLNIEHCTTNIGCRNTFRSLFSHNKVLLPNLEILELSNLSNNLISLIWDDQLLHNLFSNLKRLTVQRCGFLKLMPFHVLKSLDNLEKLEVLHCNMLEMVFGFDDFNDYKEMKSSSSLVVPLNLIHLEVKECGGLTSLMTSSVAQSMVHLTHLSISYCNQMEEVIKKQEGEDNEDMTMFFSRLKFLKLDNLQRLKRFCSHNNTFRFSLLECVTITECPHLTMFCPGAIHTPLLQSIQVNKFGHHKDIWMTNLNDTIQHRFTIEKVNFTTRSMALNADNITMIMDVFPKVSILYVESFRDEGLTFPYSSLERFPKLVRLYVEHSSFEEIFPSQNQIVDFMGKIPPFKGLYIAYLDQLKSIWKDDFQLPPIHQNLTVLKVKRCCNLVKLAPSSASFQNLTELSVSQCHQLFHLLTTSTAKSLVIIRLLKINDCKKMEEVVMNETNEDVEGGITFNQLWRIELTDMPSLKMFSSRSHTFKFPKLKEIEITGCPEMKMFCAGVLETPMLSKVKIEEHHMEWNDLRDLNKTIKTLSSAKDSVNI